MGTWIYAKQLWNNLSGKGQHNSVEKRPPPPTHTHTHTHTHTMLPRWTCEPSSHLHSSGIDELQLWHSPKPNQDCPLVLQTAHYRVNDQRLHLLRVSRANLWQTRPCSDSPRLSRPRRGNGNAMPPLVRQAGLPSFSLKDDTHTHIQLPRPLMEHPRRSTVPLG